MPGLSGSQVTARRRRSSHENGFLSSQAGRAGRQTGSQVHQLPGPPHPKLGNPGPFPRTNRHQHYRNRRCQIPQPAWEHESAYSASRSRGAATSRIKSSSSGADDHEQARFPRLSAVPCTRTKEQSSCFYVFLIDCYLQSQIGVGISTCHSLLRVSSPLIAQTALQFRTNCRPCDGPGDLKLRVKSRSIRRSGMPLVESTGGNMCFADSLGCDMR